MRLMKTLKLTTLFALSSMIFFASCKKETRELGPRANQREGISANWTLYRVQQIDVNVQLAFQESDTLLDVTETIINPISSLSPMEIAFNQTDSTCTVTTGQGSDMFGLNNGKWNFDNSNYPSKVLFNQGSVNEMSFPLVRPVRPQDKFLVLKYNKLCGTERTVSYHLWFVRK